LNGILLLLVNDGKDDDDGGCEDGPREEPDFPPALPAAGVRAVCTLAGKKGVFFGEIAVVGEL
jgi:hypothetical protein